MQKVEPEINFGHNALRNGAYRDSCFAWEPNLGLGTLLPDLDGQEEALEAGGCSKIHWLHRGWLGPDSYLTYDW